MSVLQKTNAEAVAVLLFEDYETLDVFGPVEIFGRLVDQYAVKFYSLNGGLINNRHGVSVLTEKLEDIHAKLDLFLIPGGLGTRKEVENILLIDKIKKVANKSKFVLTVCTGSALLARTGLLDDKNATSNKRAFAWVTTNGTKVKWDKKARWTVDGKYYTSSGVSAGMDMSLGFLSDRHGMEFARKVAFEIEFNWTEDKNNDSFMAEYKRSCFASLNPSNSVTFKYNSKFNKMRNKNDYFFIANLDSFSENIYHIYKKVFRTDLEEPGFVVVDFGLIFTSQKLRECMVMLKNKLSQIHVDKVGQKLNYQWMGRFDQQETTKFHLDNAADQSFLMLGYEPTVIKSKLYFADFVQFCKSINITGEEYFERYNPMFTDGENQLKPYVTEIEGFREDTYKIVLMNNSNINKLNESLGVFHKAEIIQKDTTKERVINSTMLYSTKLEDIDNFSTEQQLDFITTDKISKK